LDLRARQDTYNGFGRAFSRAFELVVTPLVFAALGLLVDHALGTGKLVAIVFGLLAVVGEGAKAYYEYARTMDAEQARVLTASRSRT